MEKMGKSVIEKPNHGMLILGNGFDLACEFKTSYKDYYNSDYYSEKKKIANEYIRRTKNEIRCSYNPNQIHKSNINVWDIFFCMVCDNQNETNTYWKDFEEELNKTLVNEKWGNCKKYCIETQFIFETSDKDFVPIYCYLYNVFIKKMPYEDRNSVDRFYDYILEQLICFEKEFGKYIKEVTNKNADRKNAILNSLAELIGMDETVSAVETFNYSNIDGLSFAPRSYHHINGDSDNPIFGTSTPDKKQIMDNKYKFTKIYRRVTQNAIKKKEVVDKQLGKISFFGSSLGDQDSTYIYALFDSIKLYDINFDSEVEFVYCIYNPDNKEKIVKEEYWKVLHILNGYDEKRRLNGTLVESLSANGRLSIKELKLPNRDSQEQLSSSDKTTPIIPK